MDPAQDYDVRNWLTLLSKLSHSAHCTALWHAVSNPCPEGLKTSIAIIVFSIFIVDEILSIAQR